jgi:hypothetical protein
MFRASLAHPQEELHEHSFGGYLMYIVMLTCAVAHTNITMYEGKSENEVPYFIASK